MPRHAKDAKALNIKMDKTIYERLEAYCEEAGQTKTLAIERIIKKFLDEKEEEGPQKG